MSLKEMSSVMRRLEFVKLALKAQESMSQLCRRFGMSRKRGYKWKRRFEREGQRGLRDRSRRPRHSPRQLAGEWVCRIRQLRRRHRSWGSKKLQARLCQQYHAQKMPSVRTVANWLRRLKLSRRRRGSRKGPRLNRPGLTKARRSNHVWTVDFKGWFRTRDGQRVEPLTVRDLFSRYVLTIRLLKDQSWKPVRRIFIGLFRENGYPAIIRTDNGQPFGSTGALGLSRLSAWWTALGIRVEFIAPGHPEQNGGHEQMHRVFKDETTRPASRNRRAQQRRTGRWTRGYNQIRPHEALGQRVPADLYGRQPTPPHRAALSYPVGWEVRRVRSNGQIKWRGRKRFVGEAFVGYSVGLRLEAEGRYAVRFGTLLIGELWECDAGGLRPAQYLRRF